MGEKGHRVQSRREGLGLSKEASEEEKEIRGQKGLESQNKGLEFDPGGNSTG